MAHVATVRIDMAGAVARMIAGIDDPRDRLRAVILVRAELEREDQRLADLTIATILELRSLDPPMKLREIGEIMETTPQRVHQLLTEERKSTNPT